MKLTKMIRVTGVMIFTLLCVCTISAALISAAGVLYLADCIEKALPVNISDLSMKDRSSVLSIDPQTGEYRKIYTTQPSASDIRYTAELSEIPEYVRQAFICTEDERFYSHNGVDCKRTFGALINEFTNMYGSTQGGSTITQQLIKNVTGDNAPTWDRKIREISRAVKLEEKYTKDEILEAYLNTIYFGQDSCCRNIYGIEAASRCFFGKHTSELSVAEAASLAAVPKNPYYDNPLNNYERNQERKEYVIQKMFELGKISCDEYTSASSEIISVRSDSSSSEITENDKRCTSWITDTAIYEFRDFMCDEYGLSEEEAINEFYSGGYDIYITADENLQNELEKNYSDLTFFPEDKNEYGENIQSAFVVMDYYGQILGIIGGIGEKPSSLCWNNATMTHRQPGSTIKPVSVYGYGIENDLITWSSVFTDSPLQANSAETEPWPENYDNYWSYKSNTVDFFLKRSLNTVPAQLCRTFGVDNVYNFSVNKMHLELDPVYDSDMAPLTVGATYKGPSLLNLTNAYLPFGNGGKYYPAHIIDRIVNINTGETLLRHHLSDYSQTISPETAYIMNRLLSDVTDPFPDDGVPGTGAPAHLEHTDVAGKTGTTQNWRDISFIALTGDCVSGIWIGYPNGQNEEAMKNTKAAAVWKNVFGNYEDNCAEHCTFPECTTVKQCYYCTESGLLATEHCPRSPGPGYYKSDYSIYCGIH